jgi:hypothetical protein
LVVGGGVLVIDSVGGREMGGDGVGGRVSNTAAPYAQSIPRLLRCREARGTGAYLRAAPGASGDVGPGRSGDVGVGVGVGGVAVSGQAGMTGKT